LGIHALVPWLSSSNAIDGLFLAKMVDQGSDQPDLTNSAPNDLSNPYAVWRRTGLDLHSSINDGHTEKAKRIGWGK
jgi:hypothetical protein